MAAYQTLALKYRPQTFGDLIGQAANSLVLRNIVLKQNVSPSYIFSGSRGTGKTSAARVFARALNCSDPKEGNPCGECDRCTMVLSGRSFDVIELDAASHGNVDDIRDLKTKSSYSMNDMEYRVFIFDEAHMMSKEAFNAMLKLIEEPPPNTVFIFATTEPEKIPETIHSRSLSFTFRRIRTPDIALRLRQIADLESIQIDDAAVQMIAKSSAGGLRDAITSLEQMSSIAESITPDLVRKFLGIVSTEVYFRLVESLVGADMKGAFEILNEVSSSYSELGPFSRGLIEYLRDALLLHSNVVPERTDAEVQSLRKVVESISEERILKLLDLASEASEKLRYTSFNPLAHFEITILKMNYVLNATAKAVAQQNAQQPLKGPSIVDRQPAKLTLDMVIAATGATVKDT